MTRVQVSDWVATVGKVGTLPLAPGTWGSLAALIVWYLLIDSISSLAFIVLITVLFAVGVMTSAIIESDLKVNDPSRVVIDEWVGQWIALLFIPKTIALGITSFIIFRIFDVWKPWPIRKLDQMQGGIGIMADDAVAGLYTLILMHSGLLLLQ